MTAIAGHEVMILGLGAMGAVCAAAFIDNGFNVRVIASGERADRIAQDGFVLNDRPYTPTVARPTNENPTPADLVIISVKQHHLAAVLDDLAPFVAAHTQIISLINGLDSEPTLMDRFSVENVLYCSTVAMTPVREGHVVQVAGEGKLFIGEAQNDPPSARVERVAAAFADAKLNAIVPVDMIRELWRKFMINVAVNQTSAVLRMPYGVLRRSEEARILMTALAEEVLALAKAADVNLTQDDLAQFFAIAETLDADGKTSTLQDVEAGRPNEVEIFAGKAVALGQQYGVPTPTNAVFLQILRALG